MFLVAGMVVSRVAKTLDSSDRIPTPPFGRESMPDKGKSGPKGKGGVKPAGGKKAGGGGKGAR